MTLELYKERCTAAALRSHYALTMLRGMPCSGRIARFQRIEELDELNLLSLAALYGCRPIAIKRAGLVGMGEVNADIVDPAPALGSVQRHRVRGDWRSGLVGDFSDLRDINLELRGLSRAIWLALLWAGGDVFPFKRRRWYHHQELVTYWPIAWACTYGCPKPLKSQVRRQLISYAFTVSAAYTRRHPKSRTHKAAEYFLQAAQQWGLND